VEQTSRAEGRAYDRAEGRELGKDLNACIHCEVADDEHSLQQIKLCCVRLGQERGGAIACCYVQSTQLPLCLQLGPVSGFT
jgi:hypothetical protein